MKNKVCVVGGFGHIGLPLSVILAKEGNKVWSYDINNEMKDQILKTKKMPFEEEGMDAVLADVLDNDNLVLTTQPENILKADTVIIIIGTPVDEYMNPLFENFKNLIDKLFHYIKPDTHIILRSTVYPGTTEKIKTYFEDKGKKVTISFCPERILQGKAMTELYSLPQIISSFENDGYVKCRNLFSFAQEIVHTGVKEAEFAKLLSNVWRYIKFATANQFFTLLNNKDIDFYEVHRAMTTGYSRNKDLPTPGFAAGPCLHKDTVQISAFSNYDFRIGNEAIFINEGLPNYIVSRLQQKYGIAKQTLGIVGMAFKANNDDKRDSLAYKLRKVALFEFKRTMCTDVYIKDERFYSLEETIKESDVIIIGCPHDEYKTLNIPKTKIVVDIWNILGKGCII